MLDPHEEGVVRAFFIRERRQQFLTRLANPKTRKKILRHLAHFYDFDPRYAYLIPAAQQDLESIYRLLRGKGAPHTCHCISETSDFDGKIMNLRDGLVEADEIIDGVILSCIPGRLAYYSGENAGRRYILER
ncbi:MAG: hypothetical protein ACRDGS_16480 [Chloroflexota bacterium]